MENFYVREALLKTDFEIPVQEKLEHYGVEGLRDGELLMLSLGVTADKAKSILENNPLSKLLNLPFPELKRELGKVGARKLLCGFEQSKRALRESLGILPVISCPADTIPFLAGIKDEKKEYFFCLYLNARNQVIHTETISIGSLSASIVHPRECFLPAIKHSAASIILSHNHPSSNVEPSKEDIELTRRLSKAGEIMGIEVIDHIIISSIDFLSLKEKGLM